MKKITRVGVQGALLLSFLAIGAVNDATAKAAKSTRAAKAAKVETTEKADITEKAEKEDNKPPIGCHNIGYQFELKTLHLSPGSNGDNQSLYVLFNKSNQTVSLFQMRDEDSTRSTYLNHTIGARQWAVLSTNERRVKFICTVPKAKTQYGQVVDCEDNISICEYTNVRYGLNNRGNYWLVNSGSKGGAASAVVHYGIIPGL